MRATSSALVHFFRKWSYLMGLVLPFLELSVFLLLFYHLRLQS
jgi:hypothetical protein